MGEFNKEAMEHRDDEILRDRLERMDDDLQGEPGAPVKLEKQIKGTYGGTRGMFNFMDLIYRLFSDLGQGILRLFEPKDKD